MRFFRLRDFERHIAFYRPLEDGRIEVLRVLHGARDVVAVLEAGGEDDDA